MTDIEIRPLDVADRNWVAEFLDKHWGSTRIVTRGKAYYAHLLPGFVATHDDDTLLAVLISDGAGGYYAGKGALIELPERAWSIAGGDLDRDGRCDLVLGTHGGNGPMILFGDGAGGLGPPKRVERPVGRAPGYAVLADLDLDGALDIVTANFESGDLAAYLSRGAK